MEEITVKTIVNRDVRKVWELWTNPEHITKWHFATEGWHCSKAVNDLKPGGHFSFRMEAKDGSTGFNFSGFYISIIPYKYIAYALDDKRQVTISFKDIEGTTEIVETFDAENEYPVEMQKKGWQAILDNFREYAE